MSLIDEYYKIIEKELPTKERKDSLKSERLIEGRYSGNFFSNFFNKHIRLISRGEQENAN